MHGGLKDEDRIFTNLYCQGDPFIKVLAATAQVSCPHNICLWCHLQQLCYPPALSLRAFLVPLVFVL